MVDMVSFSMPDLDESVVMPYVNAPVVEDPPGLDPIDNP